MPKKKKVSLYEAAKQFTDKYCKGVRVSAKYCKGCIYHVGGACIHPEWLKLKAKIK